MKIAAAEHSRYHTIAKLRVLGKHQTIFTQTAIISQTAKETNFPPG